MLLVNKLTLLGACALVTACATITPAPTGSDVRQPSDLAGCDAPANGESDMNTRMIVNLLDEERFHAALARLDALPDETAYSQYLRAHILRQLDRKDDAEALYSNLLGSCMAGYAHHGLGLLAARRGDPESAQESLKIARDMLPLDARVRNDYGYVLLLAEKPQQAHAEFMTALELEGEAKQPKYNALLTLLLMERRDQARQFARRMELTEADIAGAQRKAERMSREWAEPYRIQGAAGSTNTTEALPLKLDTKTGQMQAR